MGSWFLKKVISVKLSNLVISAYPVHTICTKSICLCNNDHINQIFALFIHFALRMVSR